MFILYIKNKYIIKNYLNIFYKLNLINNEIKIRFLKKNLLQKIIKEDKLLLNI